MLTEEEAKHLTDELHEEVTAIVEKFTTIKNLPKSSVLRLKEARNRAWDRRELAKANLCYPDTDMDLARDLDIAIMVLLTENEC